MKILGVNPVKCNGCGLCIRECPANLYTVNESRKLIYNDPENWCTGCGHCIAVCPQDAICYDGKERAQELQGGIPEFDGIRNLLLSKRTTRNYEKKDVSRKSVEEVLAIMRFAPSGHNAQPCEYIIVRDTEIKKMLADATIKSFQSFKKLIKIRKLLKPFLSDAFYELMDNPGTLSGIIEMTREYEAGVDNIFFSAPVLLIAHVPDMGGLSYVDPTIAVTYGMLAAHGLGLGSSWIGFAMIALKKDPGILKRLNIPKGRLIAGVMTLGYPLHTYLRIPVRNSLKVISFEDVQASS